MGRNDFYHLFNSIYFRDLKEVPNRKTGDFIGFIVSQDVHKNYLKSSLKLEEYGSDMTPWLIPTAGLPENTIRTAWRSDSSAEAFDVDFS